MAAEAQAHEPFPTRDAVRGLRLVETRIRERVDVDGAAVRPEGDELTRRFVTDSTMFLEVTLLIACSAELATELGLSSYQELVQSPEFERTLVRRSRIENMAAVRGEHLPRLLELANGAKAENDRHDVLHVGQWIQQAGIAVAACPIEAIEAAAIHMQMPAQGHRCRVALEALRAFLRRVDPARSARAKEVGTLYSRGKLTVAEVARVLGVSPSDAIVELEEQGFGRGLADVALSTEERRSIGQRLRDDRVQRDGQPAYSAERVLRDTLASERIEGVDARRWLTGDRE